MSQNIIPKDCSYGCNTRIYWNTAISEHWEVFSKEKHVCPNRSNNNNNVSNSKTYRSTTKPNYYNKFAKQPKPKMSNSLDLLQGPISEIQKKYEILSDIVTEYNGKVYGSQRDRDPRTGLIDLLVYYEVPLGNRDEVKRKFENFSTSQVTLERN
jgi:hypothetical protein